MSNEITPSYSELLDILKHKTKYQYFCPTCNTGPLFTAGEFTQCPACRAPIAITFINGEIGVTIGVPSTMD